MFFSGLVCRAAMGAQSAPRSRCAGSDTESVRGRRATLGCCSWSSWRAIPGRLLLGCKLASRIAAVGSTVAGVLTGRASEGPTMSYAMLTFCGLIERTAQLGNVNPDLFCSGANDASFMSKTSVLILSTGVFSPTLTTRCQGSAPEKGHTMRSGDDARTQRD